MNDKKLIITGLIIFVLVILFPFLYNSPVVKSAASAPEIVLSQKAKEAGYCVLPKEEMKAAHMRVLDEWRDTVVRNGERVYESGTGKIFNMSISSGENSCVGCHTNKAEFCDRCHNYASVRPYCWDCHNEPKEKK